MRRPAELDLSLARLPSAEIARVAVAREIVEAISTTTVWVGQFSELRKAQRRTRPAG